MSLRNLYILAYSLFVVGANAQFNVTHIFYQPDCSANSIKVNVSGNTPPYTYTWGNGMISDSISNLNGGVYAVHITDSNNKDTTVAFVLPAPPCPVSLGNVFTPNGDNINDTWAVSNAERYPNFLLQVFNRWGQIVHTQKHQYIPWDGTEFELKVPDATYYYIFLYDAANSTKYEKGSVTIVR
jgi:gliding motility-associated-like protein